MTGSEVTLMQNGGLQVEELAQGGSLADGATRSRKYSGRTTLSTVLTSRVKWKIGCKYRTVINIQTPEGLDLGLGRGSTKFSSWLELSSFQKTIFRM